jgi:acetyl esterase/lipase
MSMAMNVTSRCSRASSQALQAGLGLAADPVGTCAALALLLRGSPALASWFAGWIIAEFSPQILAGHALGAVSLPPVDRLACALADRKAGLVVGAALQSAFGDTYRDDVYHPLGKDAAVRVARSRLIDSTRQRRRYAAQTRNISYGPGGRDNLLDIWRHPELPVDQPAPVLLQVPGGAWAISDKRGQAYPLLNRMSELGWICVTINYSRSPLTPWPAHLIDVKRAIAWVRDNIADYGGDPGFIAITGGSAGAHVGSLAALTANDPQLQPGFEHADTAVQAAVPLYGAYDLADPGKMNPLMMPFLERFVMRARLADRPELFEAASPIYHVHRGAPPFFMLHGRNDPMIPPVQAREFAAALRHSGAETVVHAELPNAHHAFDTLATVRSQIVACAVADFLGINYARHLQLRAHASARVNSAS